MNRNIFDNNLYLNQKDINLSTYSFLLAEIAQYYIQKQKSSDIDEQLINLGKQIGFRLYEQICLKEKKNKKENVPIDIIKFIHSHVWKHLFGKTCDIIEKVNNQIFNIKDKNFSFVANESENQNFSLGNIMVGILQNIIECSGFANTVSLDKEYKSYNEIMVTFIVEFQEY